MRPPKDVCKELRDRLRKEFPKSKGFWHYDNLIFSPFKSSKAQFFIGFDEPDKEVTIIREDSGFDMEATGSDTCIVYLPEDFKQIGKCPCDDVDKIIAFLNICVKKYVKDQEKFYHEGIAIHKEWEPDTKDGLEEAKRLAGIIYAKGFLEELGIKE